ncbi:PilN domain-containing protein [Mariprofundus ferrooxydans]|uniref:PilN domain-containing protein n=1 Tax=Mariprofundus ferrooxydans TaxID=314344 RepID=UPI0014318823|nr:PilN domain-containing protein [Mariprofundus ferrooxydans]
MIRINLIPYRTARRQQQIVQHLTAFAAVVIVGILCTLGAHTYASLQLADLKEETMLLQKQNQDLKQKIGKIENLDHLRADVERKLKIVDRLQEGRFYSLKTLHEIALLIPENVWLNQISEQGGSLLLTGQAESNKAVAIFMRKLDQSPMFTDVRLDVISRVVVNNLPVRKFSLKVTRKEVTITTSSTGKAAS